MAPFKLATPRFIFNFAVEGSLIFTVLYGLALATAMLLSYPAGATPAMQIAVASLVFASCIHGTRKASLPGQLNIRREVVLVATVCLAIGGVSSVILLVLFDAPQRLLALLMLESIIAVPISVAAWRWLAVRWKVLAYRRERILIVGTGETARQVCRWIADSHARECLVVGFADENGGRLGQVLSMGSRIVTDYSSLPDFCPQHIDRVIVSLDEKRGKLPMKPLIRVRMLGLAVEEATSFFEKSSGKISVETLLPSWLIFSDGFKTSRAEKFLKRLVDVALSMVLLVLGLPLMLVAALLIKLESRGPVLFRQHRMGRDGREFDLLKFRSMVTGAESESGPTWATEDDPRITRIGRVLRKLHIDELPQLINVLKGQMSFVGPRPERKFFVKQLEEKLPYYALRMTARPGVTGWAQVEYGYGGSEEETLEKLKYDLYYIKNCNLLLDLWIVLKTVKVVLLGTGAR